MTLDRWQTPLALSNLTDQALRVRAVEAAATYDTDTLVQVTHAYLMSAGRTGARTSPKTLSAYGLAVRDFVPWARDAGVQLLRPGRRDGGRYLAHLQIRPNRARGRQGPVAAATVAQYLAGARALYRALNWAEATQAQPFTDAHAPPDPTPGIVKNPPYGPELDAVLNSLAGDPRLTALLLLCAHAGLRITEALSVRAAEVTGPRLSVKGKGGKTRVVPLGRRARAALSALSPLDSDGRLFDWTYHQAAYRLRKAFTQAGHAPAWRGFHAARKSSGTRLYARTRDFTRVGLFLGHASVDTTRRYVAVQDDDVAAEVEDF
jgi:integrase/recombinase XerC